MDGNVASPFWIRKDGVMRRRKNSVMGIIISVAVAVSSISSVSGGYGSGINTLSLKERNSGECGDNAIWNIDEEGRVLTISGMGDLYDNYIFNKNIDEVIISEGITSIGSRAFYNSDIQKITMPESMEKIGELVFWNCKNLTEIDIPSSVEYMGNLAIGKCESLEQVNVADDNIFFSSVDGILYNKDITKIILYPAGKSGESFVIPESVKEIGNYAFDYNQYLKELMIPEKTTDIEDNAAFLCVKSLENIYVDEKNVSFSDVNGNLYNKDKTGLIKYGIGKKDVSFEIPQGTKEIADEAFQYAENLQIVMFPASVTKIGYAALEGCNGLREVSVFNPECNIDRTIFMNIEKVSEITIFCYWDSTAYEYAKAIGVVIDALEEKEVSAIEIISSPKKMKYALGEQFYPTGLGIKVIYTDGSEIERSKGYMVSGFDSSVLGQQTLTVSYGGKYADFTIEIVESVPMERVEVNVELGVDIIEPGQSYIVSFTPEVSGYYNFYAISDSDTYGIIYDSEYNILEENDDSDYGNDFNLNCYLVDGNIYYLSSGYVNKKEVGSFVIEIKPCEEVPTEEITTEEITTEEITTKEAAKEESTTKTASTVEIGTSGKEEPVTNISKETTNIAEKPKITTTSDKIQKVTTKIVTTKESKKPGKTKILNVKKKGKNKIKLTWKKIKKVSGYQIMYSTDKKFAKGKRKNIFVKASATSKVIKKIKYNKKYYFKIRAYKKSNGKKVYGKWSKVKSKVNTV